MERLAMLISGDGTTMKEIAEACHSGEVQMEVACVISSDPKARGRHEARLAGIANRDNVVVDPDKFRGDDKRVDQDGFGSAILKELRGRGVTVVTQNGWKPLTPEVVINEYPETIFNQHPGPVPEFGGRGMFGIRVHAARILFTRMTRRDPWTEAIAQRVDENFDQGAVVKSKRVDIHPEDTPEDLKRRVLPVEHRVQIELLKDVASGNIREVPERETPLVKPNERDALSLAKRMAILLFPNG